MTLDKEPLVSIITPCFNDSKYLDKYFESIMDQTYQNIEVIFVNDGSTDNTEEIALSYGEKLKEQGRCFLYHYQKNAGVAIADLWGLNHAKGQYVIWPDADDYMTKDSIAKKVEFLISHTEYALVCGSLNCVYEDESVSSSIMHFSKKARKNPFEALVYMRGAYCAPIAYMGERKRICEEVLDKGIFEDARAGQNWQIMLPVIYKYGLGFIDEVIGYYVVRNSSLSHRGNGNYIDELSRTNMNEHELVTVLKKTEMTEKDRKKFLKGVSTHYGNLRLRLAAKYSNKKELVRCFRQMIKQNNVNFFSWCYYLSGRLHIYSMLSRTKRILHRGM